MSLAYLYVPLSNPNFVAKAATRGADVVILDLEDGVPEHAKRAARDALVPAVAALQAEQALAVRINAPWVYLWRDVEACIAAGIHTIVLPKAQSVYQIEALAAYLSELEAQYGCTQATELMLLVETPAGLENASALIRSSERVTTVIPGNEDLAHAYRVKPSSDTMLLIQQPLIRAAHAHDVRLIGTIGSVAAYKDLETYRQQVETARNWGFSGSTCIHPAQIPIIKQVYAAAADVAWAKRVVAAFEASQGTPIEVDGYMVDRPVFLRAQEILRAQPQHEKKP